MVELSGLVCVIFIRWLWLGASRLGVPTLVVMLVANDFWNLPGDARFMALIGLFEHLGLIAVLIMATSLAGATPIVSNSALNEK